jgi:general secretion pathway protein G
MKTPARLRRSVRARRAGFTLIEILLVVGIIAILMGAVLMNTGGFTDSAKITATKAKLSQMVGAIGLYESNGKTLPSNEQGLRALVARPSGRPEPRMWVQLMKEEQLNDAWGRPFLYRTPARDNSQPFEVYSTGPDGRPDTADDISSVDPL